MPCEEWSELLGHYCSAVNAYNEAVKVLGISPGSAFNEIWQRAERARMKSTRNRADLLHHEHVHACLEVGQPVEKKQTPGTSAQNLVFRSQQSGD